MVDEIQNTQAAGTPIESSAPPEAAQQAPSPVVTDSKEKQVSQYEVGGMVKALREKAKEKEQEGFKRGYDSARAELLKEVASNEVTQEQKQPASNVVSNVAQSSDVSEAVRVEVEKLYHQQREVELIKRVEDTHKRGLEKYPEWNERIQEAQKVVQDIAQIHGQENAGAWIAACSTANNAEDVLFRVMKNPESIRELNALCKSDPSFALKKVSVWSAQAAEEEKYKGSLRPATSPISKLAPSYSGGADAGTGDTYQSAFNNYNP